MKRYIFIAFFFITLQSVAQYGTGGYTMALGVRGGKFNNGVSFKYFFSSDNASGIQLDGYYSKIGNNGYTVKLFYIRQVPFKVPIIQIPLDLVYGAGVHAGYFPLKNGYSYFKVRDGDPVYYNKTVTPVGVDATIQLEYRARSRRKSLPLIFTFDFTPFYEFVYEGPEQLDFGASIRYIIQ